MGFITNTLQLSGDTYTSPIIEKIFTGSTTLIDDDTALVTSNTIKQYVDTAIIESGGTSALSGLTDVTITNPQDDDVLTYSSGEWINQVGGGGGYWSPSGTSIYYNSGNVGIGTDNPGQILEIFKADNAMIKLSGTGGVHSYLGDTGGGTDGQLLLYQSAGGAIGTIINGGADSYFVGGNVGIGTDTPDYTLDVDGDIRIANASKLYMYGADNFLDYNSWTTTSSSMLIQNTNASGYLALQTDSVDRIYIKSTGEVGINTTNPPAGTELYVKGDIDIDGTSNFVGNVSFDADLTSTGVGTIATGVGEGSVGLTINDSQGNANLTFNHIDGNADIAGNVGRITVNVDSTSSAHMGFEIASNSSTGTVSSIQYMDLTESGLDVNGTVTADNFILSSDIRAKENISQIEDISIDNIDIVSFNYKEDETNRKRYGVIAQDLEKYYPEMVYENEEGMKNVSYFDFLIAKMDKKDKQIYKLNKEVQSLNERLERLEKLIK